jgi:hypothetical protein
MAGLAEEPGQEVARCIPGRGRCGCLRASSLVVFQGDEIVEIDGFLCVGIVKGSV